MNEEVDMVYAWKRGGGDWEYHNQFGRFSVTFDETLGNPSAISPTDGGETTNPDTN